MSLVEIFDACIAGRVETCGSEDQDGSIDQQGECQGDGGIKRRIANCLAFSGTVWP